MPGDPNYNLAADFNHDGIVNQVDAKALMQNMPPLTPKVPLQLVMNLLPADQAHYAAPKNSGGSTFKKNITIEGHTMPGSIVLEDNSSGYYKWDGGAVATDANGNFSVNETNTARREHLQFPDHRPLRPPAHPLVPGLLDPVRGARVEAEVGHC